MVCTMKKVHEKKNLCVLAPPIGKIVKLLYQCPFNFMLSIRLNSHLLSLSSCVFRTAIKDGVKPGMILH